MLTVLATNARSYSSVFVEPIDGAGFTIPADTTGLIHLSVILELAPTFDAMFGAYNIYGDGEFIATTEY